MPSPHTNLSLLNPSQPTLEIASYPALENESPQAQEEAKARDMESIAGWLVNASTLETHLVIRKGKSVTIGRHQTCDLIIPGEVVSNRHCELSTNSTGFVLCKDLSLNGTYWNGVEIGRGESVILSHGDRIHLRNSNCYMFQDFAKDMLDHIDSDIKIVEKTYRILPRTLGRGTFARVNLAVHRKSNMQLAVKIMDRIRYGKPEYSGGTNIDNEVALLRTLRHANITPVVDVIKTTRYIYIFMQLMAGGDLFDRLVRNGPIPELEAKFMAYQAFIALQHLHGMGISHRDLKPENILLTTNAEYPRVLFSDFGMACECGSTNVMGTMCGTFAYMAPEVFDVKHANGPRYGYAADCWSLGVTLYVILSGTHPFTPNYATEDEKTMRLKMRREVEFPPKYWSGVSVEARVLIRFLLTIDPKKRWTADDVLDSQWIQKDVAWLRTKYRDNVLQHWFKSCRVFDGLCQPRQQQRLQKSQELKYLTPGVKRSQGQVEMQQVESGGSRAKRAMRRVMPLESNESLIDSCRESSTNNHWTTAVPDILNSKNVEGSW
ncbi:Checkpoint kinase 2 [Linnemannia schmuckeri]|uniref:Checkpoint kinase 2 n=1 Tax=Linnemannia schmuckeri TaxID=64567 RepID=A0A9P5S401_9FUNG|nr:Checkpoint kinase 2 [Linnemannia schmuckeri]